MNVRLKHKFDRNTSECSACSVRKNVYRGYNTAFFYNCLISSEEKMSLSEVRYHTSICISINTYNKISACNESDNRVTHQNYN